MILTKTYSQDDYPYKHDVTIYKGHGAHPSPSQPAFLPGRIQAVLESLSGPIGLHAAPSAPQ
eukprot:5378098-Pyramimonas_sp.AAC.1